MSKKKEDFIIEDVTLDGAPTGLYIGTFEVPNEPVIYDFDLHKADKYIREHGLKEIPPEVREMFKK